MDAQTWSRRVMGALVLALSMSCASSDGEELPVGAARQPLDEVVVISPDASIDVPQPSKGGAPAGVSFRWATVVNKSDLMPNGFSDQQPAGRPFSSFNQPSINTQGLVVFRARSRGGPPVGTPTRGIYVRSMAQGDSALSLIGTVAGGSGRISRGATAVPAPNNVTYPPDHQPAAFIEFPSIPRIALNANALATRGIHQPVWTYDVFDPATGEVSETRAGTTGIYVNLNGRDLSASPLVSGATRLGAVPGFEYHAVPGLPGPVPFDVFPGAPAITDDGTIAFKGNYPWGVGETGVFYRPVLPGPVGGTAAVQEIATSRTPIPNLAACAFSGRTTFGSTAPPSAASGQAVFVGLDNEEVPACGGIYLAPLQPNPPLTTLVALGAPVPGVERAYLTALGEGLSFDGRFMGFWGAWGTQTRTLRLYCPEEGDKERIAFCNHTGAFDPVTGTLAGDANSVCDDESDGTERCYQERQVPLNQGIFLHDTRTGATSLVARTGSGGYTDFLYWVYSGRVPGRGGHGDEGGHEAESAEAEDEGDLEAARWRASAFNAVTGRGAFAWVAFKARTATQNLATRVYEDVVDGIYLARKPGNAPIVTVVDTTMAGTALDPEAVDPATQAALPIVSLGLERDGLRGRWLVVNASMGAEAEAEAEETASQAGIYVTRVP